jgi:hypothetical protein
MAEKVTLSLRTNPETRAPEIHIEYESPPDALGHEHEQDHRRMAENVLGVPIGDTKIIVSRGKAVSGKAEADAQAQVQNTPQRQCGKASG